MTRSLNKLTEQFQSDASTLAQLEIDKGAAERVLIDLENDTEIDVDDAAKQAVAARRTIEDCTFRLSSITNRQAKLRAQIVDEINAFEHAQAAAEKQSTTDLRNKGQAFIESDEFQDFMRKLQALYSVLDSYNWNTHLKKITPKEIERRESQAIARELDWWIDPPSRSEELQDAIRTISYSSNDRDQTLNLVY